MSDGIDIYADMCDWGLCLLCGAHFLAICVVELHCFFCVVFVLVYCWNMYIVGICILLEYVSCFVCVCCCVLLWYMTRVYVLWYIMRMCIGSDIYSWEMYEWLWVCVNMWMCVFVLYMCFKCVWCKSMFYVYMCVYVWVHTRIDNWVTRYIAQFGLFTFMMSTVIYFILFYFILCYFILFYFILPYFIFFNCCFVFIVCLFCVTCIVYKGYISNRWFVYNESISVCFLCFSYFTFLQSSFILLYLTLLCLILINYA